MLLEEQPYHKSHSSTPAIGQTSYTHPLEMTNWRKQVPRSSCAGEDSKRGLKEGQSCTSSDSPKTPKAKRKLLSEKGRGLGREMVQLEGEERRGRGMTRELPTPAKRQSFDLKSKFFGLVEATGIAT